MMLSINTSTGITVALRNLEHVNSRIDTTQDRVSTGYKVIGAKDDASDFAIAQGVRADIASFDAVDQALASAKGLMDVTIAGLNESSDLATLIKKKIIELTNPANTANQQAILKADLTDMLNQSLQARTDATYNGRNQLITGGTAISFVSDVRGGTVTVPFAGVGTTFVPLQNAASAATTQAQFTALLPLWDAYAVDIAQRLGDYGSTYKQVEGMRQQNQALKDALIEGLGSTVDANLAKESANLQSAQVQQQLATQSLTTATGIFRAIGQLFA